jgi:hypothetical protein
MEKGTSGSKILNGIAEFVELIFLDGQKDGQLDRQKDEEEKLALQEQLSALIDRLKKIAEKNNSVKSWFDIKDGKHLAKYKSGLNGISEFVEQIFLDGQNDEEEKLVPKKHLHVKISYESRSDELRLTALLSTEQKLASSTQNNPIGDLDIAVVGGIMKLTVTFKDGELSYFLFVIPASNMTITGRIKVAFMHIPTLLLTAASAVSRLELDQLKKFVPQVAELVNLVESKLEK